MKVILQNPTSRLYCLSSSDALSWTPDEDRACAFKSSMDAVHFCMRHHLPAVRVILKLNPDRYYDVYLPVHSQCRGQHSEN